MAWKIEFKESVAKDLRKIDPQNRTRILDYLHKRLAPLDDPRSLGAPLKGSELDTRKNLALIDGL
jgi:mRNA interferase RelE/StbE